MLRALKDRRPVEPVEFSRARSARARARPSLNSIVSSSIDRVVMTGLMSRALVGRSYQSSCFQYRGSLEHVDLVPVAVLRTLGVALFGTYQVAKIIAPNCCVQYRIVVIGWRCLVFVVNAIT